MAELYDILKPENTYYDRKNYDSMASYNQALSTSSTVYVGNLSFFTTQDSIRELFSLAGKVVEIIMGINDEGTACGFCFVIYDTHEEAGIAVEYLSRTRLNDRVIRVDWDPGYLKGREKGRGSGGQQRREDFKEKEDAERPRKRPANDGKSREREYRGQRERGGYRGDREYRGDRGDRGDRGERRDWDRRDRQQRGDRRDRGDRADRGDRREREYRGQRQPYRRENQGERNQNGRGRQQREKQKAQEQEINY